MHQLSAFLPAASGVIPYAAVSFYTGPTSNLTILFQINVLCSTKCALCEKKVGVLHETTWRES